MERTTVWRNARLYQAGGPGLITYGTVITHDDVTPLQGDAL